MKNYGVFRLLLSMYFCICIFIFTYERQPGPGQYRGVNHSDNAESWQVGRKGEGVPPPPDCRQDKDRFSIRHDVNGPHFMDRVALAGGLLAPFDGDQPHRWELAVEVGRNLAIVVAGNAKDNRGAGMQWLARVETHSIFAEIDEVSFDLPRPALGVKQCKLAFTAIPCVASFFLQSAHLCTFAARGPGKVSFAAKRRRAGGKSGVGSASRHLAASARRRPPVRKRQWASDQYLQMHCR